MNPYLDIVIRSGAVYIFMLAAIRISGKKELSQLNSADVVLILLISNAVQNAMVGPNTSLLGGITAAGVLFLLNYILKKLLFKNKIFRDLINDKPQILIHNGNLDFVLLGKLGITNDELQEALREHGLDRFKDVKLAVLEVDGNISIISKDDHMKNIQVKHKRKHKSLGDMN
ncbi:DUF421 domain-containing protein [Pedobacter sp. JCM 36344]|uniref:DUF421 domain-containing protein n=1 Tax=Pedobacter sp. JCM 36344 TaxID=3374280 RepID=UPI00397BA048